MSIEFPLPYIATPFGPLSDPRIPVTVATRSGAIVVRFLIDTGADFSVAPRDLALRTGLDWDRLDEAHITGIERGGMNARLGTLPIRVGDIGLTIRCLFIDSPQAPFVLGRADFLDQLILTIDPARAVIVLSQIR